MPEELVTQAGPWFGLSGVLVGEEVQCVNDGN